MDTENDTLNGILDEVRHSSKACSSADWIKAEYNNQVGTSTFYSTGTVNAIGNAQTIASVSTYSITANWPVALLGSGYELDASTASDFSGVVYSSITVSTAVTTLVLGTSSPLSSNTTYYVRVGTLLSGTTSFVNTIPASTSTLANLVSGAQIYQTYITSVTVNWLPLPRPLLPSTTSEGYETGCLLRIPRLD